MTRLQEELYVINFIINDKLYSNKTKDNIKKLKNTKIILLFDYQESPKITQLTNIIYNKSKYTSIEDLIIKNQVFMKYIYNCKDIDCTEILKIHNFLV